MRSEGNRHYARCARRRERGNATVIALLALTGLVTLGSLTVLSVQCGLATSGHDRFQAIALYAAESGAAAGVDYMRRVYAGPTGGAWSAYTRANNVGAPHPPGIPGNQAQPGTTDNLFSNGMQAWYDVEILNNWSDPDIATGGDGDSTIVVRSTGYGPNGTIAQVEWEVRAPDNLGSGRPCVSYGQRGMSEEGSGRNDCLSNVQSGDTATYRPGDSP
jgi:hypothetical protein